MAVSGGPQAVPTAGLRKENIALPKPLITQQALWSQVPPLSLPEGCAGARDNVLFLPPSSHHRACRPHALDPDQHDTQRPGHFSIHADCPASPASYGSAGKKVRLRAMAVRAAWSCVSGHSPVLRARFPRAGRELPCPERNSALHGTRACRQHALPRAFPCPPGTRPSCLHLCRAGKRIASLM